MTVRFLVGAVSLLAARCGVAAQVDRAAENERYQVKFASRVAMTELVRSVSPAVRTEREKCRLAGATSGALLLGIGTIGCGRTDDATTALLDLIGLRFDGASAEELVCQFWSRGKSIVPRLRALDSTEVSKRCRAQFQGLRKHELQDVDDVAVERVCRTPEEILHRRDELISAIGGVQDCGE